MSTFLAFIWIDIFGCGKTTQDIPFTYHSDWNSAGRWSIEVFTNEGKYVLCPLEKLQFQEKGSIVLQPVEIDDVLDQEYKPVYIEWSTSF